MGTNSEDYDAQYQTTPEGLNNLRAYLNDRNLFSGRVINDEKFSVFFVPGESNVKKGHVLVNKEDGTVYLYGVNRELARSIEGILGEVPKSA